MKVLLDTNVVLDYLGANQGFAGDAEKVFELAAQYTVAETNGVDCIVTRNKADCEENEIPSYSPLEFVEKFS